MIVVLLIYKKKVNQEEKYIIQYCKIINL